MNSQYPQHTPELARLFEEMNAANEVLRKLSLKIGLAAHRSEEYKRAHSAYKAYWAVVDRDRKLSAWHFIKFVPTCSIMKLRISKSKAIEIIIDYYKMDHIDNVDIEIIDDAIDPKIQSVISFKRDHPNDLVGLIHEIRKQSGMSLFEAKRGIVDNWNYFLDFVKKNNRFPQIVFVDYINMIWFYWDGLCNHNIHKLFHSSHYADS
jgi:hypothetical protein